MSGRSRRPARETSPDDSRTPINSILPIVVAAVVVVAAGLWFGGLLPSGGGDSEPLPSARSEQALTAASMPQFVLDSGDQGVLAYTSAVDLAEELQFIPCYCGCGEHSGHRDVRDCFIKEMSPNGVLYDEHGAGCDMCQTIVLDVKGLLEDGKTLADARAFIDDNYKEYGAPTDTPMPEVQAS